MAFWKIKKLHIELFIIFPLLLSFCDLSFPSSIQMDFDPIRTSPIRASELIFLWVLWIDTRLQLEFQSKFVLWFRVSLSVIIVWISWLFCDCEFGLSKMNPARRTRFESFFLSNPVDVDPESAGEYVRSFLGKRLRVVLFNKNQQIVGTFVALDASGTLFLCEWVVYTPNGENRVTTVLVKTVYIQHIELVFWKVKNTAVNLVFASTEPLRWKLIQ
jgi:hypothetical protein